jgi:tRNA(fMet)-specific endonuclease VapC
MSGDRVLFDTNAVAALLEGPDELTGSFAANSLLFVSLFTLGELRYGAANSGRVAYNTQKLDQALKGFGVILPDESTADCYAQVRVQLRRKGRPIPPNDVWIAAIALQHRLPVLTRDAHFREVDALDVLLW